MIHGIIAAMNMMKERVEIRQFFLFSNRNFADNREFSKNSCYKKQMTSAKMIYWVIVAMMKERVEIRQCLLF